MSCLLFVYRPCNPGTNPDPDSKYLVCSLTSIVPSEMEHNSAVQKNKQKNPQNMSDLYILMHF